MILPSFPDLPTANKARPVSFGIDVGAVRRERVTVLAMSL